MHLPLHKHMSNQELGEAFAFIGGVLSLEPGNQFRVRAYQNAAVVIEQQAEPLHKMFLENPDFDKLPGIGDTLNQKLSELFTTGNIKAFQKYVADLPGGMLALDKVAGLGAKKAYKLATTFNLENADTAREELLKLAQQGKIRDLEGFGEKSENDLITALTSHTDHVRQPYEQALTTAEKVVSELRHCPEITQIEVLGSLRRHSPTVGDIDIGFATTDIGSVKIFVKSMKIVKRVVASGDQLLRIILTTGEQVDLKLSTPAEWGAFLQHFTGSKEHNIKLREFSLQQGKSLSEHGIKEVGTDGEQHLKTFKDEKEFYNYLGLNWIEPSKRVGGEEIAQAKM